MLKTRLIACLLWNNGVIVQSFQFRHKNAVGNAFTAVDFFNMWTVDEIILLDVTRGEGDRGRFFRMVEELSGRCFIPLCVGGKIKTTDEVRQLLRAGADKVSINTEAVRRPAFITEAAEFYGSQCIVVSMDVKETERGYEVYINQGEEPTGLHPVEWAKKVEALGAGEIFLTSIDRDGSRKGYDLQLVRQVAQTVQVPVIASGGVGEWQHFVDGVLEGKADAVSAANIFHYSEQSTKKAKDYMIAHCLNVRAPVFYTVQTPRRMRYVA